MALDRQPTVECIWSLVAFWLVVFAASGLFTAVLLAPQCQHSELLERRVRHLNADCDYLIAANEYMERLAHGMKHNPEFMLELARSELDYGRPDERRILAPCKNICYRAPVRPSPEIPHWTAPVVHLFACDELVRQSALLTAAVLTVVGLAFFNPQEQTSAYKHGSDLLITDTQCPQD